MATTAARLDTDAVARQRLGNFGQGKEHTTEDHDGRRCPPLCIPATARYFWLPASMGGGSSLSLHPEERAASMNDLVLDLVIVYVISNIVAQGDAIVKREQRTNVTLLSPSYMAPEQEHPPDHLVFRTMFEMFTIYVPIYFHWFSLARLENAFGRDDIVHTCKWIINMLLLVQLAGWLQVCREEQICGNYAGWMSAGKFFHVICLQYYRVYNHTHHSFQLHEESLYTGIVACGWMAVSFYMPAEVDEVEPVWFLAIFVSMAIFDLVRFTDFLPLNKKRGVFSMCASLCSSQSRRWVRTVYLYIRMYACFSVRQIDRRRLISYVPFMLRPTPLHPTPFSLSNAHFRRIRLLQTRADESSIAGGAAEPLCHSVPRRDGHYNSCPPLV